RCSSQGATWHTLRQVARPDSPTDTFLFRVDGVVSQEASLCASVADEHPSSALLAPCPLNQPWAADALHPRPNRDPSSPWTSAPSPRVPERRSTRALGAYMSPL